MSGPRTAVVLTGAAARGAFQAGALSRILPALHRRGEQPMIFLGTSAGAINASLWGALAHRGPEQAAEDLLAIWRSMDRPDVYAHPAWSLVRGGLDLLPGAVLGAGDGLPAVLDTEPLRRTASEVLDEAQLAANVAAGHLDAVGVAATRIPPDLPKEPTRRDPAQQWHISHAHSVLFLDTTLDPSHVPDPDRALRVAAGPVAAEHVLASAAIPVAFPAVQVHGPQAYAGWYVDGGVRLNAPLRPAVALGADRLVVIAAHATSYPTAVPEQSGDQPDVADAAAMTLHSILADRVIEDLQDIRTRNRWLEQGCAPTPQTRRGYHRVQVMQVCPDPGSLAALASEVLRSKSRSWWRETDSIVLGRLLRGAGAGPGQQELLSYMFFDDEYFTRQIDLGRVAADRALRRGWR